jgi:hypothetical protein
MLDEGSETEYGEEVEVATGPNVGPECPRLILMPETVEELFQAIVISPEVPGPGRYAWPWLGWGDLTKGGAEGELSRAARDRFMHLEEALKGRMQMIPFNGTTANDAGTSANADPGHALAERDQNCFDTIVEKAVTKHMAAGGAMPQSPLEAADLLFPNRHDTRKVPPMVMMRMFSTSKKTPRDNVIDIRDYGMGITAEDMPNTILSLHRGNKACKPYVTGKHGQGAASTYQFSDLTIIASRIEGSEDVAFTIVEQAPWGERKVASYQYMVVDGKIPTVRVPLELFPVGTLVRHVGYQGKFYNMHMENSLAGMILRTLPMALFPIEVRHHSMYVGSNGGKKTGIGYGERRNIHGACSMLEHAYQYTLAKKAGGAKKPRKQEPAEILHRNEHVIQVGEIDVGGRTGRVDAGSVKVTYWLPKRGLKKDGTPKGDRDVKGYWVLPNKPILWILDGQTHGEDETRYLRAARNRGGAGLAWAGKLLVVSIDCSGLSHPGRNEAFTSSRESLKTTDVVNRIRKLVLACIADDERLQEEDRKMMAGPKQKETEKEDDFIDQLQKHSKQTGFSFETAARVIKRTRDVFEEQEADRQVGDRNLPPIQAKEPPTFVRWRTPPGRTIKVYPGKRTSFLLETDAHQSYWDPTDARKSRIRILTMGLRYTSGETTIKGGRIRCQFEVPEDAAIGDVAMIQAQLYHQVNGLMVDSNQITLEVVAKPAPRARPSGKKLGSDKGNCGGKPTGRPSKGLLVKVGEEEVEDRVPLLRPIPVLQGTTEWANLGWPENPADVGFAIHNDGTVHTYYNAEYPTYVEALRVMARRGLETRFTHEVELRLGYHVIQGLNHEAADEDSLDEATQNTLRRERCAAWDTIIYSVCAEIQKEIKAEREEAAAE